MKKILMGLGIAFLCIIALLVVLFVFVVSTGTDLDKSSKAYVDQAVPLIVSSWNPQKLISRVHPEFLNQIPKDDITALFNMCSEKLGKLKEYKGSEGQANIDFSPRGKTLTAKYRAQASFEKGDAQITINIMQNNGKWQIVGFFVQPKPFAK